MKQKSTHSAPHILIIDDEKPILETLKNVLEDESYQASTLEDGNRAIETIGKQVPDLILLDICMPNSNGIKLLEQIKIEYPHQKVIMISGHGNIQIAIEALKKGAIDFIEKPLSLDEILLKIDFLKKENEIKQQNTSAPATNTLGIVGQSYLFRELIMQAEKLAPHSFPIIIYGEQGVGKTTIAKQIHHKSSHVSFPFNVIECDHITENKLAQQIVNINFTQPQSLFLKHIETLSKHNQQILLEKIESCDEKATRVIASSRIPLFGLVKENKFLPSLFYKMNIAPLEVAPLRKRPYDIPLLIDYFTKKYNAELQKQAVFTTKSIRLLRNYTWAGNITELQNVIHPLVACTDTQEYIVTPQQLTKHIGEKNIQIVEEQSFTKFHSLAEATKTFEKDFILFLLKKHFHDTEQIAQRLEIKEIELKNKMLELHI
jgi:two-component system, NtrC family, nitrogen regulation response regulator NtrX